VIETTYRVRCSGPCAGYLAVQLTNPVSYSSERWAQDATDFEDPAAASAAAATARWVFIPRLDHAFDAGWLGPDSCCRGLPVVGMFEGICTRTIADHALAGPYCPDCADAAQELLKDEAAQWWAAAWLRRNAEAEIGQCLK